MLTYTYPRRGQVLLDNAIMQLIILIARARYFRRVRRILTDERLTRLHFALLDGLGIAHGNSRPA